MFEIIVQFFSNFQNCLGTVLLVGSVVALFATIHIADKKYK
jgi:hypothetical protein